MREVCDFSEWTECTRAMHENGRGGEWLKSKYLEAVLKLHQ